MQTLSPDDPLATVAVDAIHRGDVEALKCLLDSNPDLVTARIGGVRTLLYIAPDWHGHFPNVAATIAELVGRGADVTARSTGRHNETPLHWAASSDDVAALDALLDRGANIEAPGAVIGGGTPLADAVAFGQWQAARRLVERGARGNLWQAAGLGLMSRVEQHFGSGAAPSPDEVTNAFWCACAGGQRETAQYLIARGANVNWIGYNGLTPLDAASRGGANELVEWLNGVGAKAPTHA